MTSADTWRALARKTLGGRLETGEADTPGSVAIRPLYERDQRDHPRPWRGTAAWAVSQRVDHPDAVAANRLALLDLEGGADALTLVFDTSPYARGFGLPLDATSVDAALAGIELDYIGFRLDAGPGTAMAMASLGAVIETRRLASAGLRIDLGYDPIGFVARGFEADGDDLAKILNQTAKAGLRGCPLLADGRPYHEAGASEAQELAAILGTGVAYLRLLGTLGFSLDEARRAIAFQITVDADVFLGLAKTRALRRLWARVEDASGLATAPIRLHAETAWRMMARRDPWVNVMRATAGTVAAGLGGADVVTVLPFTLPLGLPDDDARRLARNGQRVLIDEANLGRVEDPAAGAGGFEALTDDLCQCAWTIFQNIERQGGMEAALRSGVLKGQIAETARTRAGRFATLEDGLIGTNRFPTLAAATIAVLDVPPRQAEVLESALPCLRDAAPFEALRDIAEALPEAPNVFLATLGTPAAHGARATYAVNFFAVAGIGTRPAMDTRDIAALVSDFAASGTTSACICGTDKAYADAGASIADTLRGAGARRILMVAPASATEIAGLATCVDAFIHDGCDALGILGEILSRPI